MPTQHERLFHGIRAGDGLHVVDSPAGRVCGPICWENRMPLARYAVYRGDAVIGDEVRSAIGSQDGSHRTGHCGVSGIGGVGVPHRAEGGPVARPLDVHREWRPGCVRHGEGTRDVGDSTTHGGDG